MGRHRPLCLDCVLSRQNFKRGVIAVFHCMAVGIFVESNGEVCSTQDACTVARRVNHHHHDCRHRRRCPGDFVDYPAHDRAIPKAGGSCH